MIQLTPDNEADIQLMELWSERKPYICSYGGSVDNKLKREMNIEFTPIIPNPPPTG